MSDSRRKNGRDTSGRGSNLPLPPPDEDERPHTRVRFTEELPHQTQRDLPKLSPETEPFVRVDLDAAIALDSMDEQTIVDPSAPLDPTAFEDSTGSYARSALPGVGPADPTPTPTPVPAPTVAPTIVRAPSDSGGDARRRLPLPAQRESTNPRHGLVGDRVTTPGTRSRQPPPRPDPSADRRRREPTRGGDLSTAVASDPLAPMQGPLIGGRYRMVQRIGQGGMGKVFKVTHAQLGKTFALKIIHDNFAADSKARESFYREARLASSLSHHNIASVVDFGEDDHYGAFMVMEFLEGESLNQILHREKRMSVRQSCDIVLQVAEALHYIHNHKIVHCDIKTENILLCEVPGTKRRKQMVKLLDFGLARSTASQRSTSSLSGTPHYVAPERIRGDLPTPAADIYGVGILLYELLSGSTPWDGNVAQILAGHLEKDPQPLSERIGEDVDPALWALVSRALHKQPHSRQKDMAAFIYELRTVMDMLNIGQRGRRSRRKIVIERPKNERDKLARIAMHANRLPMALINPEGLIILANVAFARFVMGVEVEVEGLPVQSTPLAGAWDTFEVDLARTIAGAGVRRVIELDLGEGGIRRLLMWLDPDEEGHAFFGVHPVDG